VALEFFQSADEVNDASDTQVLGGAGAGLDGCRSQRCGAAFGEDDAVNACSVGYAKQCAEILRIFNAVEGEQEAGCSRIGGIGYEEIFNGKEFLRADECHDALVSGCFGGDGELFAGVLADADAGLAASRRSRATRM
jgi:hypothetical protein